MNYEARESRKTQWFLYSKDQLTLEQVIQEELELSEQFNHAYYSTHRLVISSLYRYFKRSHEY
ncbi:hypothetical protein LNA02_12540 [Levilactobacillus namurensis]|nr:hypothetical protein LNA02_12540 [Levilactobacillus namurensis]